jgi:flavin-dependent dehydrogenase
VTVYEEHSTIGLPQHCTGIVTPDLLDIVDLPPAIVCNRIRRMRLVAIGGTRGDLMSHDLVLDRVAFDRHLADLARVAGATIHLGHRFLGFGPPGQLRVRSQDHVEHVKADVVIAADGPASTVARAAGMNGGRRYLLGEQIRVEGSFAPDLYEVHLLVPGFFGWVVPESDCIARIGVAAREGPKAELERLRTVLPPLGQVVDSNRGLIPVYDARSDIACRHNGMDVRLVGDAAAMVKATTGGGIVPGLLSAQALHASLRNGSSYVRELSAVRRRLWAHLKIRAALDSLSDTQVARLVCLCTGGRAARALEEGSRDRPLDLLCRLLAAEPALGWIGLAAACRALAGRAKPAGAAPCRQGPHPERRGKPGRGWHRAARRRRP